jgi:hypothetical protein
VRSEELAEAVGAETVEVTDEAARRGGTPFIARVDRATRAQEGAKVDLVVDTRHLHFFDAKTGAGLYGDRVAAAGMPGSAGSA